MDSFSRDDITRETRVHEDASPLGHLWRRFFVFDVCFLSNLRRLWQNRYLIFALTQRGIRARYKQSLIGVGWALLTPLAMTLVFAYMYGALGISDVQFPCPNYVYLLFTLAFWSFFSKAVINGSTALVTNMDLVTKVYFPREVLPISSVLMNIVDLSIAFFFWALVAAGYSFLVPSGAELYPTGYPFYPHWGWLWLPLLLGVHLLLVLGLSFIFSALQVYFRDVGHLLSLGMFLWLIVTPVLVPLGAFSGGRYTALMNLNPMTGIIDGYRLAIISRQSPFYTPGFEKIDEITQQLVMVPGNWEHHVLGAVLFSVTIFLVGYGFFKHEERYFADVV